MQLDTLYSRLPAWLQDLAVTAQGLRYQRQRYGRAFSEERQLLEATAQASCLQFELLQVARLRRILKHARQHVPYYRQIIRQPVEDALRAGDWSAFRQLPITEKHLLRDQPSRFMAGGRPQRGWIPWNSSGTTGTPLTLYYTREAVSRQYAFVEQYREQAGVNRHLRRAQFTGKLIAPGNGNHRFWRRDWLNNSLYLSTVHLSHQTIPKYLEALKKFAPAYLTGYPSAIALLAQYALRQPALAVRIPVILTSAETLLESQRDAIEAAFSGKVFDQYGQTEMQSFWFECRYRRMHAHSLFGVTEILRPDGSPCAPGEVGDVVLTGLLNDAMPLIRYRVGDRAAWSGETQCPCGRPLPVIEQIDGRREDYLYSAERGWVGRLDPALKGVQGIVECQLVQEQPDAILIVCVASPAFGALDREQLEHNLRGRLGSRMKIEWQFVSAIPRGANGKFRAVVCRLPKQYSPASALETYAP
jgi:phenylacetate-CoA ligase